LLPDSAGDSQVSGQSNSSDASKTGPLAQPAEIGQIKDSVNKTNFDQKVLCWMDRSNWSQYDKPFSFAKTNEEATRNTLAGALQVQAMLIAMLDKLNIHMPTKAMDQDQSTSVSGTSSDKDQSTFFGRITSFLSGGV
jgi:hypothetical protein